MGATEVAALLKENLQQEEHTSEELNAAAKRVAATV
jgi:ferritin-like metal-binding protein YciE